MSRRKADKIEHTADGICLTCYRRVSNPFRVYNDRGRVVMGCVSEAHTGHLITPSESARWHGRGK